MELSEQYRSSAHSFLLRRSAVPYSIPYWGNGSQRYRWPNWTSEFLLARSALRGEISDTQRGNAGRIESVRKRVVAHLLQFSSGLFSYALSWSRSTFGRFPRTAPPVWVNWCKPYQCWSVFFYGSNGQYNTSRDPQKQQRRHFCGEGPIWLASAGFSPVIHMEQNVLES